MKRQGVSIVTAFNFAGQTALVTGGLQGIGRAIADGFAEAGAKVHVFDLGGSQEGTPFPHNLHDVNVAARTAVETAIRALPAPPTILVNNAGITRDRSLTKMSDEEWSQVISVNLTGAFNMIRAAVPGMIEAGGGRIINITSINGIRGKFGQANYSASKAGLIGLTKTAARELGPKGITVNAIAPGMVLTEMGKKLPQEFLDRALAETVLKRLVEPVDIANAVLFFASPAARMITGQVLNIDSGQLI